MSRLMNGTLILGICAVTTGGLVAASAEAKPNTVIVRAPPRDEVPTARVSYRDLKLNTQEGAAVLYARVKSAVRRVCDPAAATFYTVGQFKCERASISRANLQVEGAVQRARNIAAVGGGVTPVAAITITAP
ncbi:MAG: UrcA family protein [Sphingomicrobium sp.]